MDVKIKKNVQCIVIIVDIVSRRVFSNKVLYLLILTDFSNKTVIVSSELGFCISNVNCEICPVMGLYLGHIKMFLFSFKAENCGQII